MTTTTITASTTGLSTFGGNDDRYHYTYMLKVDSDDERKFYIGVRSTKKHPIDDFEYLGSSRHLCNWIKEHGADKVSKEILARWDSRKEAVQHEMLLHQIFDVVKNPVFWNRSIQKSDGFDTTGTVSPRRGMKFPNSPLKGRPKPREQVEKQRLAVLGRKRSDEDKAKMSASRSGKKQREVECPHCHKVGGITPMKIWHFDHCRGINPFRAKVGVNYKRIHIGYFPTKEEADLAKQRYIQEHGINPNHRELDAFGRFKSVRKESA